MDVKLYHGDNLDIFPLLEDESVDTVITDPPYGLEFMGKEWDHGIPGVAYWAECLRVAKPGAMLCAFGGTRTHHRLMCAIEDAGWEIRDVLMWLFGSGFPKSHDVSKAIDKAAGAEREVVGAKIRLGDKRAYGFKSGIGATGWETGQRAQDITAPATDAAALWDGYGTALKPAYEPIILAMKPLPSTFASNALDYGVAGLNVDGCRVGAQARYNPPASNKGNGNSLNLSVVGMPQDATGTNCKGRWPANLLLSHAPGCECVGVRKVDGNGHWPSTRGNGSALCGPSGHQGQSDLVERTAAETVEAWNCVPECPVRLLDEQSGELTSGKAPTTGFVRHSDKQRGVYAAFQGNREEPTALYGDTGGASRFFTRFHYSAKASRAERELGLLGHIPCLKCGLLDSVTHMNVKTGKEEKCRRNGHPTVKPLDVCRWLCRLTRTPTGGVVLDPFMGSGRISMAAILEGRDTIGIELERPSFEIAQAAVQWAQEQVPEMVQAEMVV